MSHRILNTLWSIPYTFEVLLIMSYKCNFNRALNIVASVFTYISLLF